MTLPAADLRPVLGHAHFGDAPAVVSAEETLSHADLARRVEERARMWGPERRLVLVEGANTLESLIAYLAALQHGHVALVVPDDRPDQLDAALAAHDPDIVCRLGGDDVLRETTVHELHPELALLLSTSGSTGSPKLVRLSRENVAANAAAIADYLGLCPDDRAITALPLHYCYGLSVLHSHLIAGASVVLTGLSVVDACFWDLFERAGATSFAGVPHTFDLLASGDFMTRVPPRLRQVTQAGGRLAPEKVQHWAGAGTDHGFDFVVMYGQTEATARMAWLPPELAATHPGTVGRAIPGGRLHLDLGVDERPGIGELVYSGPNVMMGYATSPADLARGAELDELRTGDLAREVDGLFEIVGRRNRYGKVFGLRLDLEALERELAEAVHPRARVVATDVGVHAFLPHGRRADQARELLAQRCGLPGHSVHVEVLDPIPVTPNGKPDYRALTELARTPDVTAGGDVRSEFAIVLGRPDAVETDTFVSLGGDSLSYVELATRLAAHLPAGLPADWHIRTIGELTAASHEAPPTAKVRVRLDTTIVLRALAIVLIVASHTDVIAMPGGAHLLLALAGFNFARFQLATAEPSQRLRHGLSGLAQLVVPTILWIGAVSLVVGTYDLTTALFVREWVGDATWDDQWHFWFLEVLVWITAGALALTCVPRLARLERRAPFGFALALLAATAAIRFADVAWRAGPTQRYTLTAVAFFFVLGWAAARAATTRQRLLVAALAAALTFGFFGEPVREAIVVAGIALVMWLPQVQVGPRLARVLGMAAGASLFVYLTHWQVYPPLEDAGLPLLAIVASFAVGIAYGSVMRPVQRTVARWISPPRPRTSPGRSR